MTNKVILGGNTIENCDTVLVINGVEVFRLRGRSGDGQLVVDFEIRDKENNLIAKVAKNNIAFAKDDNYLIKHGKQKSEVINIVSGAVLASVEEISPSVISVTGTFHVDGFTVIASTDELILPGPTHIKGSKFMGFGKAIEINDGMMSLGAR